MRAVITPSYGPATVFEPREVPMPKLGQRDVLVEVRATAVTAADLRLRAARFPSFTAVLGRLFLGVRRPRRAIQGTAFSGCVVAVGPYVTRYAVGDRVFGGVLGGAYGEYLAISEEGAMAKTPAHVSDEEAAAVPYGAGTALRFLRDLGRVARGQKVLVIGASGGVGRFAVQLAKHLGAEVTGVCSRDNFELVKTLGADRVIDRATEDFTTNGVRYDVVFDTADATTFPRCRTSLSATGRYLTLFMSVGALLHMIVTSIASGPRALVTAAMHSRSDMEDVRALMAEGVFRPIIAERFSLSRLAEAHAVAETKRVHGSIVVARSRQEG